MSFVARGSRCFRRQHRGRPGGFRRTVPVRFEVLEKRVASRTVLLVLVLFGSVVSPFCVSARTNSSAGTQSNFDEVESLLARNEGGYVDMDEDGEGDHFVDEDGDGIDDRRMKRHQKRNRQRWSDDSERGSVSSDGGQGTGGSKGYGAEAGSGPGPGGAGR